MFCPECGNALSDGQKFCPKCGTPVEDTGKSDTAEGEASSSFFGTAGTFYTGSGTGADHAKNDNLHMVMRIACGVFAVFFLLSALTRIPGLFAMIFGLRIGYFISTFFGFAAALVMGVSTAAAAWKWSGKLRNLVFGGAVLGVALRLLSLIVMLVVNLISYGVFMGGRSFFYWLGYVVVAAALFGLMHVMGCAPVVGETKESFTASMKEGFSELSGAAKDLQKQQAEKNAARKQNAAAYQAPPAGGATGGQTPPPAGGQGEYQVPPAGAPGYGMPPMGYGMPTTPPRGMMAKKTDRSIWIYILLSLVTCGIYPYFFIHSLAKDVNDLCEGDSESTSGILAFILLGFVTCGIYRIIWWYKLANRLQANGPRYNVPIQENGTTYVMWLLFGILLCGIGPFIALNFVINNTNKLCSVYNQYNGLR